MAINRAEFAPPCKCRASLGGDRAKNRLVNLPPKMGKVYRVSSRNVLKSLRGFRKPKILKYSRACAT